jgi:1-acyl-sn-glycerol-3-phosphate acyltransferase
MIIILWLRAILFNIAFFGITALWVILGVPCLLLGRKIYHPYIMGWFGTVALLERTILGLNYRLIGTENLPPAPYIVAMNHQSAWETLKLFKLFPHAAIVMKKELTEIPFWGRFAKATDPLPLDRSAGKEALNGLIDYAKRTVIDQQRPIVIFPQGTRVRVGEKKPYKAGIAKIYEALQLPIVPVAHNAGVFWPKNSFFKRGGIVTVQILPPIAIGLTASNAMAQIEQTLETQSTILCQQAHQHLLKHEPT